MSEMIERVARAIKEAGDRAYGSGRAVGDACNDLARAAIKAMREPTSNMKLVANTVPLERYGWVQNGTSEPTEEFAVTGYEAEDIWRAMIDAALGEEK